MSDIQLSYAIDIRIGGFRAWKGPIRDGFHAHIGSSAPNIFVNRNKTMTLREIPPLPDIVDLMKDISSNITVIKRR